MTASCVTASEDDALAEQIKTWWDIEPYASRCDVSGRSKEDEKALQMLEQTTNKRKYRRKNEGVETSMEKLYK